MNGWLKSPTGERTATIDDGGEAEVKMPPQRGDAEAREPAVDTNIMSGTVTRRCSWRP